MKTYYDILGISPTADPKEIKVSYRKLVKQFHPDLNKDGAKAFEEISSAYTILIHPEKRKEYDLKLKESKKGIKPAEKKFLFREFTKWLSSLGFIKAIFMNKRVAKTPQVDKTLLNMDTYELLQNVIYSTNVFVQLNSVRAILAQNKRWVVNDLLRLLYSGINEQVKIEIIEGMNRFRSPQVRQTLSEIYDLERNIKVKKCIRTHFQTAGA